MNGVLVLGHGKLPEGMMHAFQLIAGKNENIVSVRFDETMSAKIFDVHIREVLEKMKHLDGILVLCDIAGGTPFNRVARFINEYPHLRIISGVNIYSLIAANEELDQDIDDLVKIVVEESREGVAEFVLEVKENNYSEEDGI